MNNSYDIDKKKKSVEKRNVFPSFEGSHHTRLLRKYKNIYINIIMIIFKIILFLILIY